MPRKEKTETVWAKTIAQGNEGLGLFLSVLNMDAIEGVDAESPFYRRLRRTMLTVADDIMASTAEPDLTKTPYRRTAALFDYAISRPEPTAVHKLAVRVCSLVRLFFVGDGHGWRILLRCGHPSCRRYFVPTDRQEARLRQYCRPEHQPSKQAQSVGHRVAKSRRRHKPAKSAVVTP